MISRTQLDKFQRQLHAGIVDDERLAVVVASHHGDALFADARVEEVLDAAGDVDEHVALGKDESQLVRVQTGNSSAQRIMSNHRKRRAMVCATPSSLPTK